MLFSTRFRFKVDIDYKPILVRFFKREHHEAIALAIGLLVILVELNCFRSRQGSRRFRSIVHIDCWNLQSLDVEPAAGSSRPLGPPISVLRLLAINARIQRTVALLARFSVIDWGVSYG